MSLAETSLAEKSLRQHSLVQEIDYGTPRSLSEKKVTLSIDGKQISVPEGTSIMRAAMEAGIEIPKLCATDMLDAFGSCRLCLIEIDGRAGTPASCTTPVAEGIVVHTKNERLDRIRKGVMELYVSDHSVDSLDRAKYPDVDLLETAAEVGLQEVRYGFAGARHRNPGIDDSNPYFAFDPAKCIVCSRCVRACEEVQGTFALTISGRGFDSIVAAGMDEKFIESECVSCGACVQACPTGSLIEKTVIEKGKPEWSAITTCAYCGVGCAFKVEMRGDEVVRMVPYKDGKANHGHSCVKGRFAWGYANHRERILKPMLREKITEPWREVSWPEAIDRVASEFKRIQAKYGRGAVGGITSSRCTDEETFLVQKLVRAAFGNNNVDTCARVCHSPTGYGLSTTFGTSAGTQDFDSVEHTDVAIVIGANPTDAHPVFASRLKKRLRQGAKLIVIDPRRIDLVRTPHVEATYHLPILPGTNVAILSALAHVIVTEGLVNEKFVRERCEWDAFQDWAAFVAQEHNSPEAVAKVTGVPAETDPRRGAALRHRRQRRHLLRARHHRAQPGLDRGHGARQSRHGHRQHRPARRRREPAARAEQRAGLLRHGLVPARVLRLSAHRQRRRALDVRGAVGQAARPGAGPAHPQHARRRRSTARSRRSTSRARTSCNPIRIRTTWRPASPPWSAWSCRTCSSTRPPITRTCSCPARRSWKRTGPSSMPSGASSWCARSSSRSPAMRTGRSPA